MADMDYLEHMEALRLVQNYRDTLRDRISALEGTARKLRPYYFLSAEVAAYKLLTMWDRVPQEQQPALLETIGRLVQGDYADFQEYESDISMPLWEALVSGYAGQGYADLNLEVFAVATVAEIASGMPAGSTLAATMDSSDLRDPVQVSYAYSMAHDFLISQGPQALESFAENGLETPCIHRLHFKLFT